MCSCSVGKTAFKKVTHCIFDFDGTLLNTEDQYEQVTCDILEHYGKQLTPEIRLKTLGKTAVDCWKVLAKELNLPATCEELVADFREKSRLVIKKCSLMPGAENLVRHLHRNKVPIAIATSSGLQSFEDKTEHIKEFISLFEHMVSAAENPEVKNGKPSPDVFLVCAAKFLDKPKPIQCLVFEDSPNGVTAALNAGMQCVLCNPKLQREQSNYATLKISSLEEFKPEEFGLPPF